MPDFGTATLSAWGGLLYMGIGVGIAVYLSFNFTLKFIEAGVVALFGNLIPVFTLLFAWVILGEQLTLAQACCVGLVLAGVVIATTGNQADQKQS